MIRSVCLNEKCMRPDRVLRTTPLRPPRAAQRAARRAAATDALGCGQHPVAQRSSPLRAVALVTPSRHARPESLKCGVVLTIGITLALVLLSTNLAGSALGASISLDNAYRHWHDTCTRSDRPRLRGLLVCVLEKLSRTGRGSTVFVPRGVGSVHLLIFLRT